MSKNLWFADVFRGYRVGTLTWHGLMVMMVEVKVAPRTVLPMPFTMILHEVVTIDNIS